MTVQSTAFDQLQHRYLGIEAMAELLGPPQTHETLQVPPRAG